MFWYNKSIICRGSNGRNKKLKLYCSVIESLWENALCCHIRYGEKTIYRHSLVLFFFLNNFYMLAYRLFYTPKIISIYFPSLSWHINKCDLLSSSYFNRAFVCAHPLFVSRCICISESTIFLFSFKHHYTTGVCLRCHSIHTDSHTLS